MGRLYILKSFKGQELKPADIAGVCLIVELSAGSSVGTAMLLGIKGTDPTDTQFVVREAVSDAAQLGLYLGMGAQAPLAVQALNRAGFFQSVATAVLFMYGANNIPTLGGGAMGSGGYLWLDSIKAIDPPMPPVPPPGPFPIPYRVTQNVKDFTIGGDTLFCFGDDKIRPAAEPTLVKAAGIIKSHPGSAICIKGYTDNIGNLAYNLDLSRRRALNAGRWFISKKILRPESVTCVGVGSLYPVERNTNADGSDNPKGRQRNRRVVIQIFT